MSALEKHCGEIKRLQSAMRKTQSRHLKVDYNKRVFKLKKELKEYCKWQQLNYVAILRQFKI